MRSLMLGIPLMFGALASGGACSDTGSASGAANDAKPSDDAASSDDVCGPNDGNYAYCDPTTPCPALLDCWYDLGCDHPHGTCQPWDHCGDAGGSAGGDAGLHCGCDGVWRASNHHPWGVNKTCEDAGVDAPASDGG